jgi:hypothetical protein
MVGLRTYQHPCIYTWIWSSLLLNFQKALSCYGQRTTLLYLWLHICVVSVTEVTAVPFGITFLIVFTATKDFFFSMSHFTLHTLYNCIWQTSRWSHTVLPPIGEFRKFRWYWRSLLDGRHVHHLFYCCNLSCTYCCIAPMSCLYKIIIWLLLWGKFRLVLLGRDRLCFYERHSFVFWEKVSWNTPPQLITWYFLFQTLNFSVTKLDDTPLVNERKSLKVSDL